MQKYPNFQELNEAPFAAAESGGFFQYLVEREEPRKRFFGAMEGVSIAPRINYSHLTNEYDWGNPGKATGIDVRFP